MKNILKDYKGINNVGPVSKEMNLDSMENQLIKKIIYGEKAVEEKKLNNSVITLKEAVNRIKNGV